MKMHYIPRQQSTGFTLVELLLVIIILGSLALATTFLVDGLNVQSRYDDTKSRLQQIRRAVLGDASRLLNNQSELSGYIADMGRLPANLKELIDIGAQPAWTLNELLDADISPVTIQIYSGWHGPYLETLPESDGVRRFRDGWNNGDLSDVNYGWNYDLPDVSGVLAVTVQSLGANGQQDAAPDEPYDADYPASGVNLIEANDYTVNLDGLAIQLNKPISSEPTEDLILRLYLIDEGAITSIESDPIDKAALIGVQSFTNTFPIGPFFIGQYAAVLLCNTSPMVLYDGNCDTVRDVNHQPYYFKLVPRTHLPTIPWTIQ